MNNNENPRRLAQPGKDPVISSPPPIWPPNDESILQSLKDLFFSNQWGSYIGDCSEQLISKISEWTVRSRVLPCSSGTFAVELALRGLGINDGEVILAGYDFPGNFRAIENVSATPVLVDLAQNRWLAGVGLRAHPL